MFKLLATLRYRRLKRRLRQAQAELADVRLELQLEQSKTRVLELEQEKLLDVIERDRKRVQAEMQQFAATIITEENRATQ